MKWAVQGKAVVGNVTLRDGRKAKAVAVGPRSKPRGLTVLIPRGGGGTDYETLTVAEAAPQLWPDQLIAMICTQERVFGDSGLSRPPELEPAG